jgi:hypothetical protein
MKQRLIGLVALLLGTVLTAHAENRLQVVGVLGNSSGMSDCPIPYAFYSGIASDAHGRLYLAGARQGVVVCDQDGHGLAVLPLPDAKGWTPCSLLIRAGNAIFGVATHDAQQRSMLYRIDTGWTELAQATVTRVAEGPGVWAVSPVLDRQGRVCVGQSDLPKLTYTAVALDPATGRSESLFILDQPHGAVRPWQHFFQVDPDGAISIRHAGGVNWGGRYSTAGKRLGEPVDGQIVGTFRYHFGYNGALRRMDLTGTVASPGDCGADAPEIRMARQMVQVGDRYFFAGRGGTVEAAWNGTNFVFTRHIGAVYVEDLADAGDHLVGIAYTRDAGDVQYAIEFPKNQPIGELLKVGTPLHESQMEACQGDLDSQWCIGRNGKSIALWFHRPHQPPLEIKLPEVRSIGQAATLGKDLLWADPQSGTIWRRPRTVKESPTVAWRTGLSGVIGLAVAHDAVFAATPTRVARLSADGIGTVWTCAETYRGIRRLAATAEHVYVCDTAGCVVDQLDAHTGQRLARLGVEGEPDATLQRLAHPYAVAADLNGVYIADNGNGRVLVATTTLWRPEITALPRDDRSAIVAATLAVRPLQPGRMSVNVYDEQDVTVRQLVCAAPSDQPVTWDGRDQYGSWAAPGKYRYHGLIAPKLSLRYVTSIGQSGDPPYRTADGRGSWGGVWGYVMDVCPVGPEPDSDIVVLWAFEEGEGGLIRMSQDGAVRWKQHLDWWMKSQQRGVACDGESIYLVAASAFGAPEGQSKYSGDLNRPLLWRVDAATGTKRPFPATDQQHQCMFGHYLPGKRIVTDVAVRDGKVYLTAPEDNTLFVADARTGGELAAWHVEQVSGIALGAGGRIFAGSGSRIVELDATGNMVRTVADAGGPIWSLKPAPGDCPNFRLSENGTVPFRGGTAKGAMGALVASIGAPRNQVVYFSAEGKELRSLGQPGGRPKCGPMEPTSFRDPVGLCVTGNGRLFVAESAAPKRFTRWSAAGVYERQFHGPYYYSGMFGIDEQQPEHVYGDTHSDIIRYVVDYETGRWDVDHYWIDAYKDSGVPAKWWPRIRRHGDQTWWCSGSGGIVELRDDRVRGVAAVYGGCVERQADGNYRPAKQPAKTGLMGTWSDPGEGHALAEGWQVTDHSAYPVSAHGPQQGWGAYFDEDFNLYMHDWSDHEAGGVWKIPVARWTAAAPVYLWEKAEHVGLPREHGLLHGASGARAAFYHQGAVYAFNGGYNNAGLPGVGHGHDWEFAQITKYDARSGHPLWHAGQRADGFVAPGEHYAPTSPAGVIDGYLFWTDENSLIHVWDVEHGLYVDTLLEDGSRGLVPSPYTVWVELFNSRVFRHPKTGKVYLLAASDAIHVFEVLGADRKPVRFQGEFTLTEADLQRAQHQWLARSAPKQRTLQIPRCRGPVTIDGDLAEFAHASAATMVLSEHARGTARLMYDEQELYVAFDVQDDSPWRNAGSDLSTLFKTGDTVDLWLGPSPGKRELGTKDVRLLFAPQGDGTVAVAFRPKVEGKAKRVPFRSPSGEIWMDRVEMLSDVTVAVQRTSAGYRLEAAIPRAEIGLEGPLDRIGLDLSINFSDPAGQRNVARMHWARNGAAMVYDLPSEARLEPENWGLGVFEK